MIIYVFIVLS